MLQHAGQCELYYWRERGQEVDFVVRAHAQLTAIAAFKARRTLLVGADGIPVEEFLNRAVTEWLAT